MKRKSIAFLGIGVTVAQASVMSLLYIDQKESAINQIAKYKEMNILFTAAAVPAAAGSTAPAVESSVSVLHQRFLENPHQSQSQNQNDGFTYLSVPSLWIGLAILRRLDLYDNAVLLVDWLLNHQGDIEARVKEPVIASMKGLLEVERQYCILLKEAHSVGTNIDIYTERERERERAIDICI
jgi:hypothetical protein